MDKIIQKTNNCDSIDLFIFDNNPTYTLEELKKITPAEKKDLILDILNDKFYD